jgi:hypothetical protein
MTRVLARLAACSLAVVALAVSPWAGTFDHEYWDLAKLLHDHVHAVVVDYTALKEHRAALAEVMTAFAGPALADERAWTRDQRLAFWINAYNLFTIRAIVDHYPIRSAWLTLQPRNSIRQIDGVWTTLSWTAAGRKVTLDDIEHRILRPEFKEPRVHFAINCASIGCPPLSVDPYRSATLTAQLDAAARRYLAREQGVQIRGGSLRVSRILEWYAEDFVATFAPDAAGKPDRLERVARAVVIRFGPPAAVELARQPSTRIKYLDYDWSLNDVK